MNAFPIQSYVQPDGSVVQQSGGMSLRDYMAAKALSGMLAFAAGENCWEPLKTDADFLPDGEGWWYKEGGSWRQASIQMSRDGKVMHRLISSHILRMAREAYAFADAMEEVRETRAIR